MSPRDNFGNMPGNRAALRLSVPPCLRRSGYAQAGLKVLYHIHLPFVTIFMQLAGLFDIPRELSHMFMVERKWGILS
jgi:hypothetical protein